jgi:ABC-type lipoprotein release transport system permease subunit
MKIYKCDICGRSSDSDYFLVFKNRQILQLLYTDKLNQLKEMDVCEKCFDIYVANIQNYEKELLNNMTDKKFKRKIKRELKKMTVFTLLWRDIKGHYFNNGKNKNLISFTNSKTNY